MNYQEGVIVGGKALAVGIYRYPIRVSGWESFGLQWLSEGAGVATHTIYVSSAPRDLVLAELDPSSNSLWQEDIRLAFLAEPSGAGSVRPLGATCHLWSHILVEIDVTTALDRYSLFCTTWRP